MPAPTAKPIRQATPAVRRVSVTVPRCIIVTGPRHAGKTRWLQETIHTLRADHPSVRCAVLTAEEGATAMERFVQIVSDLTVRRLFLPCPCCPAVADLPRHARALVEESGADWLFVELPVLPAIGLIAEFDTFVHWPREVVVCLNAHWAKARRTRTLSYFQTRLVDAADRVIDTPDRAAFNERGAGLRGRASGATPVLTLV